MLFEINACTQLCTFFELLTVGQQRLRDMQMHLRFEQKKNPEGVGLEPRSTDLQSNTLQTKLSGTRIKEARDKWVILISVPKQWREEVLKRL